MAGKVGEKRPVTIYLEPETYRLLAHWAIDEDQSLPELIRGWVFARLNERESQKPAAAAKRTATPKTPKVRKEDGAAKETKEK